MLCLKYKKVQGSIVSKQDTQYSIVTPQCAVYDSQQYVYPPNYPQSRASTYQNIPSYSQNFHRPYNFPPRQGFEGGQRHVSNFTHSRK